MAAPKRGSAAAEAALDSSVRREMFLVDMALLKIPQAAAAVGAFRRKLMPAMEWSRPAPALAPAGFDSRREDPLGLFRLRDDDFRDLTGIVMEITGRRAQGWLVSVLEGGCNLDALPPRTCARWRGSGRNEAGTGSARGDSPPV